MKTRKFLAPFAGLCLLATSLMAAASPRLVGASAPAPTAVPVPETTPVHCVSDDGRWVLLTSASDRLTPNDFNAAADVFLFDRSQNRLTLISATPGGRSGNGASLAGGFDPQTGRVAFLRRASNLVPGDGHAHWDLFQYELVGGRITLASPLGDGATSMAPVSEPRISPDGRQVVFRSRDGRLPGGGALEAFNLFRHDLAENRTVCLTTN